MKTFCLSLPERDTAQWPSFTIIWRKTEFPGRDGVILHWWGPINGGTVNGLRTFVTQWGPSTIWNHCMNHCEQLASSELSVPIIDILQQVITMGNYIKPRPLPAQSQLSLWLAENWPSYICNRHFRKTKQTQAWEEPEYYSDKPSYGFRRKLVREILLKENVMPFPEWVSF